MKTSTNCICIARSVLESVEETCFREACCGVRSGGVFLEESVRVVEGKETGLRRVCYWHTICFFRFAFCWRESSRCGHWYSRTKWCPAKVTATGSIWIKCLLSGRPFWLDVLGVVASSKPSPESSDQFMLFPYPCESCKFIRHLAVHCFRP